MGNIYTQNVQPEPEKIEKVQPKPKPKPKPKKIQQCNEMKQKKKQRKSPQTDLFVVGYNYKGQLCLNHDCDVLELINCKKNNKNLQIQHINNGLNFTIITTNQQKYFVAGDNLYGQCGIGNFNDPMRKITENQYFKKQNIKINKTFCSPYSYHCLWLTQNNQIYSNGYNLFNQCGISTNSKNINIPTLIDLNHTSTIQQISLSYYKTYILYKDGNVYKAGFGVKNGFNIISFFKNKKIKIKYVASGALHTLFIDTNHRLFTFGNNEHGQLGFGDNKDRNDEPIENIYFSQRNINIKQIVCGAGHSLIGDDQGRVYAFGWNEDGDCGINSTKKAIFSPKLIEISKYIKMTKIKCGWGHSLIGTEDGKYWLFGRNDKNQCTLIKDNDSKIIGPYYINRIFDKLTNNSKTIKEIYLGNGNTWITTTDDDDDDDDEYKISQAMVLIICISEYDSPKWENLPGCKVDKENMINLWKNQYKYDIMYNKKGRVDIEDLSELISECKAKLNKKKNKDVYDALFIIFSCHGNEQNVILSDGYKYQRDDILSRFNGKEIINMSNKPKIIIMDAGRGTRLEAPILNDNNNEEEEKEQQVMKGSCDRAHHPYEGFILLYATTKGNQVPDDEMKGGNLIYTMYDIFGNDELIIKYDVDRLVKKIQKKVKQLSDGFQCIEQRNLGIDFDIKLTKNVR